MTYTNTQIEETVTSMPQPPSEQEPYIVIRKRATVKNLAGFRADVGCRSIAHINRWF